MADESLRLPTVQFRAVFDLGPRLAATITLPENLAHPDLYADYDDEDTDDLNVSVDYDDGQLHLQYSATGIAFHFHGTDDEGTSPWPQDQTEQLLKWAVTLTREVHELGDLLDTVADAAEWFEHGLTLYVPETEPVPLELIEVAITGELMTLPWLGAGNVLQDHIDGDNHPIALLWTPDDENPDPDRQIATAWVDPLSGEPQTRAIPGTDWQAVGMAEDEVLRWLADIYDNHHVAETPDAQILRRVLERMGGLS